MKLTPLHETVKRLNQSLPSKDKEVERWVIDNDRPLIAVRQNNLVTVCFVVETQWYIPDMKGMLDALNAVVPFRLSRNRTGLKPSI